MGKATQDLKKEHESILHVLEILDKMMSTYKNKDEEKLRYYKELIYFLKIFADKCHHGKEEKYLFEAMINKGVPKEDRPIGILLREHDLARQFIAMMEKAVTARDLIEFNSAAVQYSNLIKSHIDKENNILFVTADQLFNEGEQDNLFGMFEEHEENVIGHGVHEELHAMIHKWEEEFNV